MPRTSNLAQMELGINRVTPEFLLALHEAKTRVILWGPVGIGKTDVCSGLARHLTRITGKDFQLRDKIVSHMPPEEISGLQVVDREKRQTFATRPSFMGDPNQRYVLLLDEYTRAPQSYRNTLLQFLLSGAIGEHKMHPDSIIILASNASADDITGLHRLSYADRNRIVHLNVYTNYDIWSGWAVKNNVHPFVMGFLANNDDKLQTNPSESSNEAFASPRTWAMVSNIFWNPYFTREETELTTSGSQFGIGQFHMIPSTREQLQVAINGTIGTAAAELFAYIETLSNLPSPVEILEQSFWPENDLGRQYGTIASTVGWLSRKKLKPSDSSTDEKDLIVVPTNLDDRRFLQYIKLLQTVEAKGRADMRLMAVRLLFKGLGFLYPNRQWNEANPTVLDYYIGRQPNGDRARQKETPAYKELRKLIEEFIQYYRDN